MKNILVKIRKEAIIFILFILFSIVLTYPLLLNLNKVFVIKKEFYKSDTFGAIFLSWYFGEEMKRGNLLNLLPITKIYYPYGITPLELVISPIFSIPTSILFLLFNNPIVAYNIFLVFSMSLTGYGFYYFSRYLLKEELSAILSGLTYISTPLYLHAVFIGDINFVSIFLLPFILLISIRKVFFTSVKHLLIFGILIGMLSINNIELFLYTLPVLLGIVFTNLFFYKVSLFSFLKSSFLLLLPFMVIFFIWYGPFLHNIVNNQFDRLSFKALIAGSFTLKDFFYFQIYPIPLISLIGVLIFIFKRTFFKRLDKFLFLFLFFYICTWVYALGANSPLYWTVRNLLPSMRAFVSPARVTFLGFVFSTIFAGITFRFMIYKLQRVKYLLFVLSLLFIFLLGKSSVPPVELYDTKKNLEIYSYLASLNENISIIELPIEYEPKYLFNIIFHKKPIINGASSFLPLHFLRFLEKCGAFNKSASFTYFINQEIYYWPRESITRIKLESEECQLLLKKYSVKYLVYNDINVSEDEYQKLIKCSEGICLFKINI